MTFNLIEGSHAYLLYIFSSFVMVSLSPLTINSSANSCNISTLHEQMGIQYGNTATYSSYGYNIYIVYIYKLISILDDFYLTEHSIGRCLT